MSRKTFGQKGRKAKRVIPYIIFINIVFAFSKRDIAFVTNRI